MTRQHTLIFFIGLVLLAIGAIVLAAFVGSMQVSFADMMATLGGGGSDVNRMVILELRLPRAAAAFVVGGLLALAGTLMQVLLRNPLADPYVLGVSGGAAVAALVGDGLEPGAVAPPKKQSHAVSRIGASQRGADA